MRPRQKDTCHHPKGEKSIGKAETKRACDILHERPQKMRQGLLWRPYNRQEKMVNKLHTNPAIAAMPMQSPGKIELNTLGPTSGQ